MLPNRFSWFKPYFFPDYFQGFLIAENSRKNSLEFLGNFPSAHTKTPEAPIREAW